MKIIIDIPAEAVGKKLRISWKDEYDREKVYNLKPSKIKIYKDTLGKKEMEK